MTEFRDSQEQATFHEGREYERDIQAKQIKELEAEKESQDEHIELLNQCDDSSTEVIGKMDKGLEVKAKRIAELEDALIDLRTITLRKFSQVEMQCLLLQNIEQALKGI